jgi:membrane protease YdiL (CAAX protease family)
MIELLWNCCAYVAVAVIATLIIFGIGWFVPTARMPRVGLLRLRPVLWSGYDVFLAFCIYAAVPALLIGTMMVLGPAVPFVGAAPDPERDPQAWAIYSLRCLLISTPLFSTAVLATWFTVLFVRNRVRPQHYGLSWGNWPANVALGLTVFIWLTPVVLGLFAAVSLVLWERPQPFTPQNTVDLAWWEWGLVAFQACVAAPMLEEILFRGLLQNWLRQASLAGHLAIVLATLVRAAIGVQYHDAKAGLDVIDAGPLVFALLLAAGYLFSLYSLKRKFNLTEEEVRAWQPIAHELAPEDDFFETLADVRRQDEQRQQAWRQMTSAFSVYGSAMLFAMLHVDAWPAPIALFVMGLGLGILARSTQSLIGPIVFHAAFNLVAFITLYGTTL